MAVDTGDDIFLIDCGVTFDGANSGANLVHPDFAWVVARRDRLRAIVLTHGHEDHLGAVPFLLQEVAVPVIGPRYAISMLKERLPEYSLPAPPDLRVAIPGQPYAVGKVMIEHFEVTHSMPDATGLIMTTPVGTVVHTGDFKIDRTPLGTSRFDFERLRVAGDQGVRLLLSDSTNVYSEGHTGSETTVVESLAAIIEAAPARVVIGQFASNVQRLAGAIAAARQCGRRVCVLGRSARTHLRLGIRHGMVEDTPGLFVELPDLATQPRREVLIVASGTQGEEASALSRLAADGFDEFKLEAGDTVIFSSRTIPGNELAVHRVIDQFARRGMILHHRGAAPEIHASGHAKREEQREMLELVRPRGFVPVHGTLDHLIRHARMAEELGVVETLVATNGTIIEVTSSDVREVGRIEVSTVSRTSWGEILADEVLRDRSQIGRVGHAVVTVVRKGNFIEAVRVAARGIAPGSVDWAPAERWLRREVRQAGGRDGSDLEERAGQAMRRYCARHHGTKPLVDVIVVEARS